MKRPSFVTIREEYRALRDAHLFLVKHHGYDANNSELYAEAATAIDTLRFVLGENTDEFRDLAAAVKRRAAEKGFG